MDPITTISPREAEAKKDWPKCYSFQKEGMHQLPPLPLPQFNTLEALTNRYIIALKPYMENLVEPESVQESSEKPSMYKSVLMKEAKGMYDALKKDLSTVQEVKQYTGDRQYSSLVLHARGTTERVENWQQHLARLATAILMLRDHYKVDLDPKNELTLK